MIFLKTKMYNPISLEFFDQLEVAIQRKIPSTIIYIKDEEKKEIKALVIELKLKNHKEYLVLKTKEEIALESILSFNGKVYKKI